jgi:hypothetical protein
LLLVQWHGWAVVDDFEAWLVEVFYFAICVSRDGTHEGGYFVDDEVFAEEDELAVGMGLVDREVVCHGG